MRITPALALSIMLGCGAVLADTVYYRCVDAGNQTSSAAILLVTIDPLLGEMNALLWYDPVEPDDLSD